MRNTLVVGCAVVMACAGSAFAQVPGPNQAGAVTLNFIELEPEAGIALTGTDFSGAPIVAPTVTGETYHVGVPFTGGNTPIPDYRTNHIGGTLGVLANGGYLLVNILEVPGPGDPDGGAGSLLSDQIYVYRDAAGNTHIDFYSDPNQFVTLPATSTITEDGTLQFGLSYMSDQATPVYIFFTSDVPTPGAAAALGLGGLAALHRRRR